MKIATLSTLFETFAPRLLGQRYTVINDERGTHYSIQNHTPSTKGTLQSMYFHQNTQKSLKFQDFGSHMSPALTDRPGIGFFLTRACAAKPHLVAVARACQIGSKSSSARRMRTPPCTIQPPP